MSTLQTSPDSPSFAPSPVAAGFVYSIPPTDGELLVRFTRRGDTEAFAELVELHAPLVLSVCRQVLRRPADVDDAFQATFMILAKRAGDIRASDSAAGWLYRVAYRTSVALARRNKSRPEEPLNGHDFASPECDPLDRIYEQHSVAVMIEELRALPARYQEPLVLCYLEGHSRSRAAEMLDSTTATIKGRLARGKQLLRHRLARRGVALSIAAGIASSMVESAHAAASSTTLATQTAHAASQFVSSTAAATTSSSAVACSLAQNGVSAMLYASLAKPALAAIAVLAIGAGTVLATDAAKDSPTVAIGGVTLQASAASDANDEGEAASVAIEAHRPPAPPVDVTTRVDVASPIPPNAITIQADASGMTDTTLAQPSPTPPTITVSGTARGAIMGAPSQPAVPQWNSAPSQFGGFVDVTTSRTAESDQPGIEELQLEMRYWETRAEGLEQKSKAIQKKYEVINAQFADGTASPQELAEASVELGEATLMRAEVFQAKAKVLEMKRKIAAREKQASAPVQRDVMIAQRRGLAVPAGEIGNWSDTRPARLSSTLSSGPTATLNGVPAHPPTPPTPPVSSTIDILGELGPPQPVMPPNAAFGVAAPAQPAELRVFWQSDLDAALDIAKRDGRKVIVHFVGPFGGGDRFIETVENTPEVKRFLALRSVPVKIAVDAQPALAERLAIKRVPTVCIFTAEGELIDKFTAPEKPRDYLIKLQKLESPVMQIQVQGLAAPQPYNPEPVRSQDRLGQPLPGLDPVQPVVPVQPVAPQPPVVGAAPAPTQPHHPPIDPNELAKLKQELDALRQQCDQLQRELEARNKSVGELLNPRVDPQERSQSEEEETETDE
ncbi:sigma-70 family RNA polymerase sigma factor [Aeoliella sp. SH292]|uniref:sigma-70 family RNA polymerase sigma factor n=1 Tax=Aeoliella sp. SH292 TaxID=3454464 RepID=UPI003F9AA3FA